VLHIYLICVLTTTKQKSRDDRSLLTRLARWKMDRPNSPQLQTNDLVRSCSIIEELTLRPFTNTRRQLGCKITFILPIARNIPGTSRTYIGEISYYLVATLNTENGANGEITHQEIKINRKVLANNLHSRILGIILA
jgi:hypothetical protein